MIAKASGVFCFNFCAAVTAVRSNTSSTLIEDSGINRGRVARSYVFSLIQAGVITATGARQKTADVIQNCCLWLLSFYGPFSLFGQPGLFLGEACRVLSLL